MNRAARSAQAFLLVCLGALAFTAPPAQALSLGFNGDDLAKYAGYSGGTVNEPALAAGLANARGAGAETWRFMLVWRQVAPGATAPTAAQGVDPSWSGYDWGYVDRLVRHITATGMEPLPWVARAPNWAEGPNRPAVDKLTPAGTWRPSATALGQFAQALSTRYSGRYPDPARPGQTLPRVATFQAWNEPNLFTEITPQWVRVNGRWAIESVGTYRKLLNAFYRGIKKVQPTAKVLGAGTGPFGGLYPGDTRLPPARFDRELLCATERGTQIRIAKSCPKLLMDGWAHHTYPIGPPTRTARNRDDVVVPDMHKLTKLFNAAARARLISTAAAKNVWMTEMSWDSYPDPSGLSLADHAIYMEGAFYALWKAKVTHILWWNSRDDDEGGDWNAHLQSGIFLRGSDPTQDTRKPAWTAFHFPFTAYRSGGVAALWARPPSAGAVAVQARAANGTWTTVSTLSPRGGGVMTGRLRVGPGTTLRAVLGEEISLPWKTF